MSSLCRLYVPKLRRAYPKFREETTTSPLVTKPGGNPVKGPQLEQYLAFTHAEQHKAGVPAEQAVPPLRPGWQTIVQHIDTSVLCSNDVRERSTLTRDRA